MENANIQELINAFLGYRDMLAPVLDSLTQFVDTYRGLREDIGTLNNAFEGDVAGKLERIYQDLSKQAARSADLSAQIDRFVSMGARYVEEVGKLSAAMGKMQEGLDKVGDMEKRVDEQLSKLDAIVEEKRNNYNVKELQRSLENYNANVQKVSDFVNKDVSKGLAESTSRLDGIRSQSDNIVKELGKQGEDIEALLGEYRANNALLKKLVEQKDVDEAYLFDALDRWAKDRGVKTKK